MDNHYPGDTLPRQNWFGVMTRAHWARQAAKRLVIFVHGFGGDPVDTWANFPDVLRGIDKLADCDFIFYGYDGLTDQANNAAAKFHDFLDRYLAQPADIINGRQPVNNARAAFTYDRVVIVAHSLGAVVTRRALLRAQHVQKLDPTANPWLGAVRLVLFAPAHNGAHAAAIANAFLMSQDWWVAKVTAAIGQVFVPLLQELATGSQLITQLMADTTTAAATAASMDHLIAKRVVWADDENVVFNQDFFRDPPSKLLYGTDHFSVCKPDAFGHAAARIVLDEL